jgi:glycerol-3-phosphate cytidylyltransferase-like family protein
MNKVNYLALGAVGLAVIAIFSPWVEVSGAGSPSDVSESFQPVIISGISMGFGIFGLLVALVGGYLAYKENKWTFLAGIVNFINGYGYLHEWFGASTRDSGNYGDVTSRSSVDPKFGIYLFILASLLFIVFTLKNYKLKKTETVLPIDPSIKEPQQPVFRSNNTAASQRYQPSKIQTMTTTSSEKPTGPESTETPKVPVQPTETSTESAQYPETPNEPVHTFTAEPTPVIHQAPRVTATPQQPVHEPEIKKSSTSKILLIILAIVLVGSAIFVMTYNTSQKSKDKTEQSVNDEKARLEIVINEVNQAVSDKKYDDALLKINSINWLFEPDQNKGYVDQYNSQRENLRKTIEQLKTNQTMEVQKQATDKTIESTIQTEQTGDTIH